MDHMHKHALMNVDQFKEVKEVSLQLETKIQFCAELGADLWQRTEWLIQVFFEKIVNAIDDHCFGCDEE